MRKVLLVTGGSRGIGAAVCRMAAARGWDVAVNYAGDSAAAATVTADCQAAGARAIAIKADIVDAFLRRFNVPDDVPIEAKMVSNAIRSAQTQVEGQNFEIRKNVLKYDEVMNRQRVVIYEERRRVLEGADLHEQVRGFLRRKGA